MNTFLKKNFDLRKLLVNMSRDRLKFLEHKQSVVFCLQRIRSILPDIQDDLCNKTEQIIMKYYDNNPTSKIKSEMLVAVTIVFLLSQKQQSLAKYSLVKQLGVSKVWFRKNYYNYLSLLGLDDSQRTELSSF